MKACIPGDAPADGPVEILPAALVSGCPTDISHALSAAWWV